MTPSSTPAPAPETAPAPPVAPPPAKRRPILLIACAVLGGALVVYGGGTWIYRATANKPPAADLTGVDPAVAWAINYARDKVVNSPRSAAMWGQLGMVLRAHEYLSEADLCFDEASRLDPNDPRWPYLLSRGLRGISADGSLPYLERAVKLCGDVATPRLALGEILIEKGQLDDAAAQYRTVLAKEPDNPRAHLGMGRITAAQGDPAASLKHFEASAKGAPQVKATHAALAAAYHRRGDAKAADAELRLMSNLSDDWVWPDPYIEEVATYWVGLKPRLAWATELTKQGKTEEAIRDLQSLVRDYPDDPKGFLALGQSLNRLGRTVEAERALRKAIRLQPTMSASHFELGYALQHQQKQSEAEEAYRAAIGIQPELALAHYNLSFLLTARGDYPGALAELLATVRYKPDYADAYKNLGILHAHEGRKAEALKSFQRAAELAPGNEAIQQMLRKAEKENQDPKGR